MKKLKGKCEEVRGLFETPVKVADAARKKGKECLIEKEPIRMSVRLEDIVRSVRGQRSVPKIEVMEPEIEEFNEVAPKRSQKSILISNLKTKFGIRNEKTPDPSWGLLKTDRVRIKPKYIKSKEVKNSQVQENNRCTKLIKQALELKFGKIFEIKQEKIDKFPDSIVMVIDNTVQMYSIHKLK